MRLSLLSLLFFSGIFSLFAQNQNLSNGVIFDGEPYLAVNPSNPQHLVVAWMGYSFASNMTIRTRVSMNGGQSWSQVVPLPHFASTHKSADPSLAFGSNGELYACYIDYRENPDSGGVYVIKSLDGGLSWGTWSKAMDAYADGNKRPIDRPWLASGSNNHLYLTTKPAPWVAAPNRPYFVASVNGGMSWQNWQYVDGTGYLTGSLIASPMAAIDVAADGTVHCMYPSYVPSQNILPGFIHAKSTDGGTSFTYNNAYHTNPGASDTLAKMGYRLVCDPSDSEHLAFVFLQNLYGDIDVFSIESHNGGATWTAPKRVNDDPQGNGKMQDLVWADYDTDGDLAVVWRDRRNAPGTGYKKGSEIWGAVYWKDSANFSNSFNLCDSLINYDPVLEQKGNDFMCVTFVNDTISAAWGDVRSGRLNIWFARKAMAAGIPTEVQNLASEKIPNINIYPNPAKDMIYMEGDRVLRAEIYDIEGKKLLENKSVSRTQWMDVRMLPAGNYYIYLETSEGNVYRQILKGE